jgi:PAS domain-containing protein
MTDPRTALAEVRLTDEQIRAILAERQRAKYEASGIDTEGMRLMNNSLFGELLGYSRAIEAAVLAAAREVLAGVEQKLWSEKPRKFIADRICYQGYSYGMGAQDGIDDLRRAIKENGHG